MTLDSFLKVLIRFPLHSIAAVLLLPQVAHRQVAGAVGAGVVVVDASVRR